MKSVGGVFCETEARVGAILEHPSGLKVGHSDIVQRGYEGDPTTVSLAHPSTLKVRKTGH